MEHLTNKDVQDVLLVSGIAKRKRKRVVDSSARYGKKMKLQAEEVVDEWIKNGIPSDVYNKLKEKKSDVIRKFGLFKNNILPSNEEVVRIQYCQQMFLN